MKKFLLALGFIGLISPLATVSARQPYASELYGLGFQNPTDGVKTVIRATSTDPFFLNNIVFNGTGAVEYYCDNTLIYVTPGSTAVPVSSVTFKTPIRCAGSILVKPASGVATTRNSIAGFSMSDANFDKPIEVATSTAAAGGGSGSTAMQSETFATVLFASAMAVLSFVSVVTFRRFIRPKRR